MPHHPRNSALEDLGGEVLAEKLTAENRAREGRRPNQDRPGRAEGAGVRTGRLGQGRGLTRLRQGAGTRERFFKTGGPGRLDTGRPCSGNPSWGERSAVRQDAGTGYAVRLRVRSWPRSWRDASGCLLAAHVRLLCRKIPHRHPSRALSRHTRPLFSLVVVLLLLLLLLMLLLPIQSVQ